MLHFYGLIVGIAVVVWWNIAERLEPRLKRIIPMILMLSLLGARTYHVIDYWDYYQYNLLDLLHIWEGGLSIWGALIIGGGYTLIVARNYLWAVVIPLPLAQAIGRVANGVNGEFVMLVFGIPWWSAELILNLVLFGTLWMRRKTDGAILVAHYLVGYGVIRLVLGLWREDSPYPAILMLLAGLTLIGYIRWLRR